jgi:hypothetical protein
MQRSKFAAKREKGHIPQKDPHTLFLSQISFFKSISTEDSRVHEKMYKKHSGPKLASPNQFEPRPVNITPHILIKKHGPIIELIIPDLGQHYKWPNIKRRYGILFYYILIYYITLSYNIMTSVITTKVYRVCICQPNRVQYTDKCLLPHGQEL